MTGSEGGATLTQLQHCISIGGQEPIQHLDFITLTQHQSRSAVSLFVLLKENLSKRFLLLIFSLFSSLHLDFNDKSCRQNRVNHILII